MTTFKAYNLALSQGRAAEFAETYYRALKNRMSNEAAVDYAIRKLENLPSTINIEAQRAAYQEAFKNALDSGMSEQTARMAALRAVPRR